MEKSVGRNCLRNKLYTDLRYNKIKEIVSIVKKASCMKTDSGLSETFAMNRRGSSPVPDPGRAVSRGTGLF